MLSSRWSHLRSEQDVDLAIERSHINTIAILKHSTRCGISMYALNRLESGIKQDVETELYYLDLLSYRPVSNYIADVLNVIHQSPQLILVKNGKVVDVATHHSIEASMIQ